STPFCCSTCSLASKCSRLPLRPCVMTCGCSQNRTTSSIVPSLRAATIRFCNAYASAYPISPKSTCKQTLKFSLNGHRPQAPGGCPLKLNLQPAPTGKAVAHRFPHRGMRVDHAHHVVDRAFEIQHRRRFRENLRRERSDNVNSEDFAVLLVAHNLNEAAV